jgi:hypothetical protein
MMETSINPFFGRIAALQQSYAICYPASRMQNCQRGAHSLAYHHGMSRSLRAVRLALHPETPDY